MWELNHKKGWALNNWCFWTVVLEKILESPLDKINFFSSHVWMWELNHKKGWALNNWCFRTVVLEKILESPLDCTEIKWVNPKGTQSWIFIGRTAPEAEAPIPWPLDAKSWHIRKDPDAGKDWRREEKGMTEHKMVGWHHWLNGHEFEQALGDGEAWSAAVHRVAQSWTQLSNWITTINL